MLLITTSVRQGPQNTHQPKTKSTVPPGKFSLNMTNITYYIFHSLEFGIFVTFVMSLEFGILLFVTFMPNAANS